ncbi:hypothetical protein D3C83_216310 [compost metagenome]
MGFAELFVDVEDGDLGATLGEHGGSGAAEARGSAGDDRGDVVHFHVDDSLILLFVVMLRAPGR